jgi:transcriptional regulator with XRE-family HTH domain
VTQAELAERINSTKSYISKLEKGHVTPSAGLFFSIINALGMRVEIVKPL